MKFIDQTHWRIDKKDWVYHHRPGETIDDLYIVAQVRCPKCHEYFTVVHTEIDSYGIVFRKHPHSCGMKHRLFKLEGYKTRHA